MSKLHDSLTLFSPAPYSSLPGPIASRSPIKFKPQVIAGKDIHFWLTILRLNQSNWGKRLLQKSSDGVLDTGIYKIVIDQGKPDAKQMFKAFTENGIVWGDETREDVDAVIFATGYIPNFEYLCGLNVLDSSGVSFKQSDENIRFCRYTVADLICFGDDSRIRERCEKSCTIACEKIVSYRISGGCYN